MANINNISRHLQKAAVIFIILTSGLLLSGLELSLGTETFPNLMLKNTIILSIFGTCLYKINRKAENDKGYQNLIIESIKDGIAVTDSEMKIEYANKAFCRLTGLTPSQVKGKKLDQLISATEPYKLNKLIKSKIDDDSYCELKINTKKGKTKIVKLVRMNLKHNKQKKILNVLTDVTCIKNLEKELLRKATLDELTGLYNRNFFNSIIQREVELAFRKKYPVSFIMLDVDNFKEINDTYSHFVGDKVLTDIARCLKNCIRDSDLAFRYGGDEFVLVLPDTDEKGAKRVIQRIKKEAKRCNKYYKKQKGMEKMELLMSCGCSTWEPWGQKSWKDALKESDIKMYQDKMKKIQ